jgi:hyperosmotically inducible protein
MKYKKIMEEVRIMKKVLMIVVALIISVVFVTMVVAQDKPAAEAKSMRWMGEVVSVDSAGKTVVAKNKKGEMTFDVSAAKFATNVKLDGLNAGDKIAIKYEEKDGKNVATSIAMAPVKKAKSKKESAGEYIDDSVITTKIKSLLAEDDFLKSFQIGVKTRKGVVQLKGFVNSQQAIDKAVEITNSVKGVKSIKNNLIVK